MRASSSGRIAALLPWLTVAAAAALAARVWPGRSDEVGPAVVVFTVVPAVACVVTAAMGGLDRPRVRLAIATLLLAGFAGFIATHALGRWPLALDAFGDRRYTAVLALAAGAAAIGLNRGAVWARWIGLAFGVSGIVCGVLAAINLRAWRGEVAWQPMCWILGGVALATQLAHPAVRARFVGAGALWASADPRVAAARRSAVAACVATPMLLVYAASQPLVSCTAATALPLAVLLAIGAALVAARRTAGVLMLGALGVALLAQATATLALAPSGTSGVAAYYAVFWVPCGLFGIVGAARVLIARSS